MSRQRLWGSAIVLVLVLPHLIWQARNGWPTLEFIRNVRDLKNAPLGPGAFWASSCFWPIRRSCPCGPRA